MFYSWISPKDKQQTKYPTNTTGTTVKGDTPLFLQWRYTCLPCDVYSSSSITRAKPKSATLQTLFSPIRMFLAAKSRWIKFLVSRYAIPDAICNHCTLYYQNRTKFSTVQKSLVKPERRPHSISTALKKVADWQGAHCAVAINAGGTLWKCCAIA